MAETFFKNAGFLKLTGSFALQEGRMKNRFIINLAIIMLALSGALTVGASAQTTNPGPGPSEQPDAPMEIGQPGQQNPDAQPSTPDDQSGDAQPTEAQPG